MKAIVFLAEGFEECEALITVDILRRAGIETVMASVMDKRQVVSARDITVHADAMAEDVDYSSADIVILPGGRLGVENLGKSDLVKEKCREFAAARHLAAICAAPSLPASLGLLDGKRATCHPDFEPHMGGAVLTGKSVTVDGNIITGQGLGATFDFAFTIIEQLAGSNSGVADEEASGADTAARIKKAICYKNSQDLSWKDVESLAAQEGRMGYCCE